MINAYLCRVLAWEPVPQFRAFMEYGILLNGIEKQVHVRPFVAASIPGETYKLTVPQRGIWGTASVNGGNIDKWVLALSPGSMRTLCCACIYLEMPPDDASLLGAKSLQSSFVHCQRFTYGLAVQLTCSQWCVLMEMQSG